VGVNLGGEPERDDFGLPPVDIEIPDDARELDRDVQAYHREQRALRRHLRRRRLRGPLSSDGMVMPLLAGCLVCLAAGRSGWPRAAKTVSDRTVRPSWNSISTETPSS